MSKSKKIYKSESEPKYPMPPISDDLLESLIATYSIPVTKIPDPDTVDIWTNTETLKSWLLKTDASNSLGLHRTAWFELRKILDAAVESNDPKPFEAFSRAWSTYEFEEIFPRRKPRKVNKITEEKNIWVKRDTKEKTINIELLNSLIPASCTKKANSPVKVNFIEEIGYLQRKLKRAPTRKELELATGISKNKVAEFSKEMKINNLLSGKKIKTS